ncbi:MAG: transglycosylase domain-containing protein [Anaerolineae bacterium]|nr:transglycosylase domain-containing protein [Thermoflexales bacterium]MDW8395033.1 transglycosylase domain-containing protein [Anaerolineae bacterium]
MNAPQLVRLRRHRQASTRDSAFRRVLRIAALFVVGMTVLSIAIPIGAAVAASAVYTSLTRDLPNPDEIVKVREDFETTKIYDRRGTLLYEIIDPTGGDRQWVKLDDISPYLICATVAIEDKTFWENQGFDVRGIARAFVANLRGGAVQGGSGITQQLVKQVILPPEERAGPKRTTAVKIKEVLLAAEVTRRYSKRDILEWYLNTNFYGNLAYGIEAAARVYFGKSARDLNLAEAAMLAHIPQSPRLNPFNSPNEAKFRQSLVLDLMVERTRFGVPGCAVTPQEAAAAKRQPLTYASRTQRFAIRAPHFSIYAKDKAIEVLADHLGIGTEAATSLVERGGLKIYTTLDLEVDEAVRQIANAKIAELQAKRRNVNNAAVVVLKQDTGEIIAMVGSLDYFNDNIDGKFNVALAPRQPGSAFKPITYLELLRQGASPATLFWDVRTAFDSGSEVPYLPENYDREYHGPVLMREALARSYNIPAVEALRRAGIGNVIRLAHRLGITDLDAGLRYGLPLALGSGEVKLLDLTYAYATIANDGNMIGAPRPSSLRKFGHRELDPAAIMRIEDRSGRVLYEYRPAVKPNLLGPDSPRLTYLLKSILSDPQARAAAFGFPSVLDLSNRRPAAVKTGTTNEYRDNWTLGFTTDYTVGVWVGNSDGQPMSRGVTGLTGAAPIWKEVMELLHRDLPIRPFPVPEGLIRVSVCVIDGMLANDVCPSRLEWFIPGTEPTQRSTTVQNFPINRETGKLALPGTPPELVELRPMYVFPPQAMDWYASLPEEEKAKLPLAPTDFDARFGGTVTAGDVAIISPRTGAFVSGVLTPTTGADPANTPPIGVVPILGNARGGEWLLYRVFFAPGWSPTPEQWQQIGSDHSNQVSEGLLENWNVAGLPSGPYSLKVVRQETNGQVTEFVTRVTLDNTPPALRLLWPINGQVYTVPDVEWVDFVVDVQDDYAIGKVEFYANGELFVTKTAAPFTVKWMLPREGGVFEFYVVAYDGAGNRNESQRVTVAVQARPN